MAWVGIGPGEHGVRMFATSMIIRISKTVASSVRICHRHYRISRFPISWFTEIPAPDLRSPRQIDAHGMRITDSFAWMENPRASGTRKYLTKENSFAKRVMTSSSSLIRELQKEMLSWKTEVDVQMVEQPDILNGFEYLLKENSGKSWFSHNFPVYCRRNVTSQGNDVEVILDPSHFMSNFVHIQSFRPSPCQQYLAIVVDLTGGDCYSLFVMKPGCSNPIQSSLFKTDGVMNVQWTQLPGVFVYTTLDNTKRAYQAWCHKLNTESHLLYEENDTEYFVDISRTKDGSYIAINCNSRDTSEIRLVDGYLPMCEPVVVFPRRQGVEWYLEHWNGVFYALTNFSENGEYQLVRTCRKLGHTFTHGELETMVESRDGFVLEDIDLFHDYCVLFGHQCGKRSMSVLDMTTGEVCDINLPNQVTTVEAGSNLDINSDMFSFNISSPLLPVTAVSCTAKESSTPLIPATDFQLSGIVPSAYVVTDAVVMSHDNQSIPLILVHDKDVTLDGSNPCVAFVYGAYGQTLDSSFRASYLSLLKRKWVLAFCHVRGGGELGRMWYKQGRMQNKLNTFLDFESCVRFLHNSGYSRPSLTAVSGTSAGGMAVGWLCNNRPNLIRAALLKSPFVDVLNTMLSPDLPLTSTEYGEWGRPRDDINDIKYILSYCPYMNVKRQQYPALLISTSFDDERVPYWGPAKFVARIRHMNNCVNDWNQWHEGSGNLVLLWTEFDKSGHFSYGDAKQQSKKEAFEIAFLVRALNLHGQF